MLLNGTVNLTNLRYLKNSGVLGMLALENITLKRDRRTLISGLSVSFCAGNLIHVQGVNGVGKTTLLRCLSSLTRPDSGRILFQGDDIAELLHLYHQQFLYLGHAIGLKEDLNALDNLRALLSIRGQIRGNSAGLQGTKSLNLDTKIIEALTVLGLKNITRPIRQLSAGQRRRVALARLFLEACPLWILDEPFTALDAETITLLEHTIKKHCEQGGLVIMTSHQALSQSLNATPLVLSKDGSETKRVGG